LLATTAKVAARKQWMSDHLQLRGSVNVDDGAAEKVRGAGKSLLAVGVLGVDGDFHRGDVIAVRRRSGEEIGRGLSNYSSAEARLIAGKSSSEFQRLLGFTGEPELIHRDNFVLS
jgi:glutamate 5-kinase